VLPHAHSGFFTKEIFLIFRRGLLADSLLVSITLVLRHEAGEVTKILYDVFVVSAIRLFCRMDVKKFFEVRVSFFFRF
jgi:hypothetical protein